MDSIRAVADLANADERGDPAQAAIIRDGHALSDTSDVALLAIRLLARAGMRPADDRATQTRLANALTRSISSNADSEDRSKVLGSIMNDYLLQEAAAARLVGSGGRDPLDAIADPASERGSLNAASILKRSSVNAHSLFDRADAADLMAIASGRYDAIANEHTRFGVSSQLRLDARAMSTPTIVPTRSPVPMSKGPADVQPQAMMTMAFGRKGVAER